ncbi:hypothetical protein ACP275_05G053000 [Erythranthe tilingii]
MCSLGFMKNPMKRAKGEDDSNSVDRISELPKDILQRILYFLSQEYAVRTSILSKSWRYVWRTRPNLDFSDNTFRGNKKKFHLCLEEFHLSICLTYSDRKSVPFLEKWIPLLTAMDVKKFCLSIQSEYYKSVRVELPRVVFGEESLQDLNAERFVLEQEAIERIALSKHLKKLRLEEVYVKDDTLSKHLKKLRLEEVYVKDDTLQTIIIYPTSLETLEISRSNIPFHKGADFRNLKDLCLCLVESSLDNLSSCEFPSLKRLNLRYCDGLKESHISIDAPNMVCFGYAGCFIPSISFTTTSNEWNTYICLDSNDASSNWFVKLKALLESLSQSNICLAIDDNYPTPFDEPHIIHEILDDNGCNEPIAVECLQLNAGLSCFATLLNGLFRICRPTSIGDIVFKCWEMKVAEFAWNILMRRESQDRHQFRHELWLRDLERVSLEIKEIGQEEWRSITLSDLPNHRPREHYRTHFALKWRQSL